jgi:hypothetical protein
MRKRQSVASGFGSNGAAAPPCELLAEIIRGYFGSAGVSSLRTVRTPKAAAP